MVWRFDVVVCKVGRPAVSIVIALLATGAGSAAAQVTQVAHLWDAAPPASESTASDSQERNPAPGSPAPGSPAPEPQMADPKIVEKGRRAYRDYCQKCHGLNMVTSGGGFFDLRTFPQDQKPRFVSSVTNGKRAMPAWGSVLKSEEIDWLWTYVLSVGSR